jgi:hypothetical protein
VPWAISGKNRIYYESVIPGGAGALVGPGALPSSAPSATAVDGTELSPGVRQYAITYQTASGESLVGPRVSVAVGLEVPMSPPSSAPTATPIAGTGLTAGTRQYAATYLDGSGNETLGGPTSAPVTTAAAIADPTTALTWTGTSGGSLVPDQTYRWRYSWVRGDRETGLSPHTEVTMPPLQTAAVFATIAPPSGWSMKLYRTTAGPGATYKHATNATFGSDVRDGTADAALGATAPAANDTERLRVSLSAIPVGGAGVTQKRIYRTVAGGAQLKLLATLANATTTLTDSTPDASLGANIPTSSGTATGRVQLSSVPIGPAGVTGRRIWRTIANGATLKLLTAISDNSTTSYLDLIADGSLGASEPPTIDTSGLEQPKGQVNSGSTTIPVAGTSAFRDQGGWARVGEQVIQYTGKTSTSLTGIPASGSGALTATISYNSTIVTVPMLTGIPTSGAGSIQHAIVKGESVNRLVTIDSAAGQAALAESFRELDVFQLNVFQANVFQVGAATETGVIEEYVQDRRLTAEEGEARARAILALREFPETSIRYATRDPLTRAGRTVTVMLPDPVNVNDDFKIQRVHVSDFRDNLHPLCVVEASDSRFSFEDLLRQIRRRST